MLSASTPLKTDTVDTKKIVLAALSGLLLTGAFPKADVDWLAWFALVPLLFSLRNLAPKDGFRLGFIAGLFHYLTLIYWVAYTIKTYGHLPLYLCVSVLVLLSAYLALYVAVFAAAVSRLCRRPASCLLFIPVIWVSLEYVRSFLLTGFPWEFIGYTQFRNLYLIQISDIFGVYGVSFLIAFANAAIFLTLLYFTDRKWQGVEVFKRQAASAVLALGLILGLVWSYGERRIKATDVLMATAPSPKVTIVQGNIPQSEKWDPTFQIASTEKYVRLSLSAKKDAPELVVWPETATPFYFLHDTKLSEIVQRGVHDAGSTFLIGSPSFARRQDSVDYYNSAYLISPDGKVHGKYNKTHLVPFGEYVPLKTLLPFVGKLVEGVGDFRPGLKGQTVPWNDYRLGIQICYEIIFPNLARAMTRNNAALLVNLTNDAWYGRSSAPYQHFSMAVFRAIENRRSLIRSANTGISGFIDPVGRIMASTPLFQDAAITQPMPLIQAKTIYTRFGDLFALLCTGAFVLMLLRRKVMG